MSRQFPKILFTPVNKNIDSFRVLSCHLYSIAGVHWKEEECKEHYIGETKHFRNNAHQPLTHLKLLLRKEDGLSEE